MSEGSDSDEGRWQVRTRTVVYVLAFLILTAGVAIAITGTVPVSDGVTLQAPDGMTATLEGSTDAHLEEPFPTSGTVEWTTEAGNASFFSSGSANATVHKDDLEGTWTNITAVDADPNSITINPDDKDSAIVAQEVNTFAWSAGIAEDDGTVDFSYDASGPGEVTVQGVAASERLAAIDADSGQILDDATSNGGGAVTFDALDSGDHDVQIQAFTPATPTLSNPDPTGDTSSAPTQLSVDVSDGDFPRGDSVDVTIDLNGNQIHSETITSNQTVTVSVPSSGQTGGTHSWSVEADDSYGETASDSYSYNTPQNLTIRDEETNEIIDDRQVNLTVYTRGSGQQIFNFSTSTGEIDLSGFPVSESFIVVAEADDYIDRRIFVQNVYETQTLYLLNESVQHTDVIFRIEDYTGSYPPDDTVLEVQRGIGNEWETVLGDYFGANDQFESQLRYNVRHRLVLRNAETGDTRVLGSYTPLASGTETITVSPEGDLQLTEAHPRFNFSPATRSLPSQSDVNVSAGITPGSMDIDNWQVNIYHIAPNGTNTTIYTESDSDGGGGSVNPTLDLSGLEGQVKVVTSYELDGGAMGTRVAQYVLIGEPTTSMTLLDGLLATVGLVPDSDADSVLMLTAMILTVVGTTAVGSVFRMTTEGMGMVTLALITGFAILGWVEYNLLFTLLVLFVSIVFIRRRW